MKKITFSILIFAMLHNTAIAMTGNELKNKHDMCNRQSLFDCGYSFGYILGVADSYDDILYSIPQGATCGQINEIILNYISTHPEHSHKSAAILIIESLKSSFPMNKTTSKKQAPQKKLEKVY